MVFTIAQKELAAGIVALEMTGIVTLGRSCSDIEFAVNKLIESGISKVIFDLSKVSRMDSSGIGIIVMACGRLKKAGGSLKLVGVQEKVRDVLIMTQIDKVVGLFDTTEAAAASF
jgi:anti-sigma B factor antagonist